MTTTPSPTIMTRVHVVLRDDDTLSSCLHIAEMVDAYLDSSAKHWSVRNAACAGYFRLLERLGKQNAPIDAGEMDWAMRIAADKGDLRILQWLSSYRPDILVSPRIMDSAAFSGHLHIVQWLHENRDEGCTTHAMDSAAARGFLNVVQWLHENRSEGCTTAAMNSAAAGGHLKIVQWLHANRDEGCTAVAMDFAVFRGHLHIMKFLLENDTEKDTTSQSDGDDTSAEHRWHPYTRRESFSGPPRTPRLRTRSTSLGRINMQHPSRS